MSRSASKYLSKRRFAVVLCKNLIDKYFTSRVGWTLLVDIWQLSQIYRPAIAKLSFEHFIIKSYREKFSLFLRQLSLRAHLRQQAFYRQTFHLSRREKRSVNSAFYHTRKPRFALHKNL